jgi:hypothetical protein
MRRSWIALIVLLGCAGLPEPPAPGTAQVFGRVRLVPREGVTPGKPGAGSYGDRRLRDVEFVDYSQPGFAVVYVEQGAAPGGVLEMAIRSSRLGVRIEPALAAVGAAGRVVLRNDTPQAHVFSYPAAGAVRPVEPGERLEFAVPRAGEQGLFLLDVSDVGATVFAAPGAFTVVSTGRFALRDLAPGPHALRVWHPRFPPALRHVDLAPDTSLEVDLEIGVGREGHADAH